MEQLDREGSTFLVTGANSGIGFEVARALAQTRARVVMACRDEERGRRARDEIRSRTDNQRVDLQLVDLSSQQSIRQFCGRVRERYDRLDGLVNNAGIYPAKKQYSVDGIELTWATNVLGYFLTSNLLEPLLVESAPARVVNVASRLAGRLRMDDLQFEERSFSGLTAYMQSKQANRMLSWVRAERLRDRDVTVNAVHPGTINTSIHRHQEGLWGWLVGQAFAWWGRSPREGARTPTWLVAHPDPAGITGAFWEDRQQLDRTFDDERANRELWERCQRMVT